MSSLKPSPRMAIYCTDKICFMETYDKIQEMKSNHFRLKGCLLLPNGKINLLFYEQRTPDASKINELMLKKMRMRSFSSHR